MVNGRYILGGAAPLVQNQMYFLMHEIVHFFLGNAPGPASDLATEVNEIGAAVELGAEEAISNAQSYVFYTASELRS